MQDNVVEIESNMMASGKLKDKVEMENRETKRRREKAYAFMGWPEHRGLNDPNSQTLSGVVGGLTTESSCPLGKTRYWHSTQ